MSEPATKLIELLASSVALLEGSVDAKVLPYLDRVCCLRCREELVSYEITNDVFVDSGTEPFLTIVKAICATHVCHGRTSKDQDLLSSITCWLKPTIPLPDQDSLAHWEALF